LELFDFDKIQKSLQFWTNEEVVLLERRVHRHVRLLEHGPPISSPKWKKRALPLPAGMVRRHFLRTGALPNRLVKSQPRKGRGQWNQLALKIIAASAFPVPPFSLLSLFFPFSAETPARSMMMVPAASTDRTTGDGSDQAGGACSTRPFRPPPSSRQAIGYTHDE
jgi:hypothetical protein